MTTGDKSKPLSIEIVKIDSLRFDETNARKHSANNIAAIKQSLEQFGQRKPIVITADKVVLAGNGTLLAATELGITDIAVTVVPNNWTKAQAKAYAIADNRTAEMAEWDGEALLASLKEIDAAGLLDAVGFNDIDLENLQTVWDSQIDLDAIDTGDEVNDDDLIRISFKVDAVTASKWEQACSATGLQGRDEQIALVIQSAWDALTDNA